jgi:hypothetical protein
MFFGIPFAHAGDFRWLWLLPIICFAFCLLNHSRRNKLRRVYVAAHVLKRTTRAIKFSGQVFKACIYAAIGGVLALALAWPLSNNSQSALPKGTKHITAIFDVSGSMRRDVYRGVLATKNGAPPVGQHGTCLDMALHIYFDQVRRSAGGNKMGVVVFNDLAESKAPLCEDVAAMIWMLKTKLPIRIGGAPGDGSDWPIGLLKAAEQLTDDYEEGKENIVFLFTDGAWKSNQSDLQAAVDSLKALNMRLIVVGLGSTIPGAVDIYIGDKKVDVLRNRETNAIELASLNEAALLDLVKRMPPGRAQYIHIDPQKPSSLNEDWTAKMDSGERETTHGPIFGYFLLPVLLSVVLMLCRNLKKTSDAL